MGSVFIEGLGTTIVGMLTVFAVLALLSFVLYLLKYLNKEPSTQQTSQEVEQIKEEPEIAPVQQEETTTDDLELIAVITAVIASSLNTTSDRLEIKSIVKVNNWNKVARREQQRNIF